MRRLLQFASLAALLALGDVEVSPARDARSTEILRLECGSEFSRRDITLFANGTVRLREGAWESVEMYLEELGPDAMAEKLRVLAGIHSNRDIDRVEQPLLEGARGRWDERCEVRLHLPGDAPFQYRYSSLDVLPLKVGRLILFAEELTATVRPLDPVERLPDGYEPVFGDVLRDRRGLLFRVQRLTADEQGVELIGVDQPITIYVAVKDLRTTFVALEEEGPWRRRP